MSDDVLRNSANIDQARYWNSASGKKWVTLQEGIDRTFSTINDRLLERAAPRSGDRVLDVGCGTGATSMIFADQVGIDGAVVGIDISQMLVNLAEIRCSDNGLDRVEYRVSDVQTHDFENDRFDLITSRFGVMFFEDPVSAFANLANTLGPNGRLVFVSWAGIDGNPWFEAPRDAAIEQLGEPGSTDPTAPGPLAFADINYVHGILDKAGFAECVGEEETVYMFNPGTVEEVAHLASNIGPAARILKEFDGTSEDITRISRAVAESFGKYVVDGGVSIPAILNFFEAAKFEAARSKVERGNK